MRKAYVVSQTNSASASAIRVKLTTYKPARPVTMARFRGMDGWSRTDPAFCTSPMAELARLERSHSRGAYGL